MVPAKRQPRSRIRARLLKLYGMIIDRPDTRDARHDGSPSSSAAIAVRKAISAFVAIASILIAGALAATKLLEADVIVSFSVGLDEED